MIHHDTAVTCCYHTIHTVPKNLSGDTLTHLGAGAALGAAGARSAGAGAALGAALGADLGLAAA